MPTGSMIWLRLTKESVYGTFDAAALPADVFWPRLVSGDGFSVTPQPQRSAIRGADGGNLRQTNVAQRKAVTGTFRTPMYPSQAVKLVGWALPVAGVLPSYTADFWDGIEARRYLGTRVERLVITSNSQQDWVGLEFTLRSTKVDSVAPTLPQPAPTVFPGDAPYFHQDLKGNVTLAGASLTAFSTATVTIANIVHAPFDEDVWVTAVDYCGRDVGVELTKRLTSNANRVRYEDQTSADVALAWTKVSPAHAVALNFQSADYLGTRTVNRDFGQAQYEALTFEAFNDVSTGVDMAVTLT